MGMGISFKDTFQTLIVTPVCCCAAGGGGEEAQSLFGLQLGRASEPNLLRQLRQLHGAPALAQTRCQGTGCEHVHEG